MTRQRHLRPPMTTQHLRRGRILKASSARASHQQLQQAPPRAARAAAAAAAIAAAPQQLRRAPEQAVHEEREAHCAGGVRRVSACYSGPDAPQRRVWHARIAQHARLVQQRGEADERERAMRGGGATTGTAVAVRGEEGAGGQARSASKTPASRHSHSSCASVSRAPHLLPFAPSPPPPPSMRALPPPPPPPRSPPAYADSTAWTMPCSTDSSSVASATAGSRSAAAAAAPPKSPSATATRHSWKSCQLVERTSGGRGRRARALYVFGLEYAGRGERKGTRSTQSAPNRTPPSHDVGVRARYCELQQRRSASAAVAAARAAAAAAGPAAPLRRCLRRGAPRRTRSSSSAHLSPSDSATSTSTLSNWPLPRTVRGALSSAPARTSGLSPSRSSASRNARGARRGAAAAAPPRAEACAAKRRLSAGACSSSSASARS
ncbi:hypothetical protein JKP88DRAFT_252131 [Tribonema minus]|uniref:Uncharacterized protein n=1 Tax=Tribonema minus TaxID=303371 RepID=A0A836CMF6_9STRA|nr:hypothetical protein JKP88DRAFT_252131 [Tribonema minus]